MGVVETIIEDIIKIIPRMPQYIRRLIHITKIYIEGNIIKYYEHELNTNKLIFLALNDIWQL